jgi:hypothetical protein
MLLLIRVAAVPLVSLHQALDEVRRGYWNELRRSGDRHAAKRFKDTRWCLLTKPEKLTDQQTTTLARIRAAGGEVWRAYELKEAVRGIFQPRLSIEDVEILIDRLLSRLARSSLEPFVRLGKAIRRHREGILAAIRLGINQGRTEARWPSSPARSPRAVCCAAASVSVPTWLRSRSGKLIASSAVASIAAPLVTTTGHSPGPSWV